MKPWFVAAIVCLLSVRAVSAGVVLLTDERSFYAGADADADQGSDHPSIEHFPYYSSDDPFMPWGAAEDFNAIAGSAIGRGKGTLETITRPDLIAGAADLFGSGQVLDETAYAAGGGASALLRIGLAIDEPSVWRVRAMLSAAHGFSGSAQSTVAILLGLGQSAPELHRWYAPDLTGPLDVVIHLEPGEYTFLLEAGATASNFGDFRAETASAAFDGSFTLLPEPATGLVLLAAGMWGRGRRQSRT